MNYYDILLAKKLEDDRDPKVEGLSVTANGTYSEEGKVYKPVVVNVAGYSLEDMPSGAISSFNDGAALPLNNLKINIDPVQSGSGNPSPTNIRPISGWGEVNVTVADDTTDPTTENVYTIDLGGTRYGGKLDVVSGVLTVDRGYADLGTLSWSAYNVANIYYTMINDFNTPTNDMICSTYKVYPYSGHIANMDDESIRSFGNSTEKRLFLKDTNVADISDLVTKLNGVQLVYPLKTPTTIQLTPTQVRSLLGNNNIFADTGNIIEGQYFKSL